MQIEKCKKPQKTRTSPGYGKTPRSDFPSVIHWQFKLFLAERKVTKDKLFWRILASSVWLIEAACISLGHEAEDRRTWPKLLAEGCFIHAFYDTGGIEIGSHPVPRVSFSQGALKIYLIFYAHVVVEGARSNSKWTGAQEFCLFLILFVSWQ